MNHWNWGWKFKETQDLLDQLDGKDLVTTYDCPHCAHAIDAVYGAESPKLRVVMVQSVDELKVRIPNLSKGFDVPAIYDSNSIIELPKQGDVLEGFLSEASKWKS